MDKFLKILLFFLFVVFIIVAAYFFIHFNSYIENKIDTYLGYQNINAYHVVYDRHLHLLQVIFYSVPGR